MKHNKNFVVLKNLLIKKGIITHQEFEYELEKYDEMVSMINNILNSTSKCGENVGDELQKLLNLLK